MAVFKPIMFGEDMQGLSGWGWSGNFQSGTPSQEELKRAGVGAMVMDALNAHRPPFVAFNRGMIRYVCQCGYCDGFFLDTSQFGEYCSDDCSQKNHRKTHHLSGGESNIDRQGK